MVVRFAELDEVNLAFSTKKATKALTEDLVRKKISEYAISVLNQEHTTKGKNGIKTTKLDKVLKKVGDKWYLRLYYGVAAIAGAVIDAPNEGQAIKEAIEYCEKVAKGNADGKTNNLIKEAYEAKKKSLDKARTSRGKSKS